MIIDDQLDKNGEKYIKLAKLNKEIFKKLGKNELKIESSILDLLFHISPYVDLDKKINISMEQLKSETTFRNSTFQYALEKAIELNFIEERNGYYYSNYHDITSGDAGKYSYIPNLSLLTSSLFKNYTLNEKRLFLYFLTSKKPSSFHNINLKNLYTNHFNDENVGVRYFKNYRDVLDALIRMVEFGHIELRAEKDRKVKTTFKVNESNKNQIREKILNYFGVPEKDKQNRKVWLTQKDITKYQVSVKITDDQVSNIQSVNASQLEIMYLLERYGVPSVDIKETTMRYIIANKNHLFESCGELGLSFYRDSLNEFFANHSDLLSYYDQQDKMANYFVDFYLLKNCENTVKSFINNRNTNSKVVNQLDGQSKLQVEQMRKLLNFINEKASEPDLFLLHNELSTMDNTEKLLGVSWLNTKNKTNLFIDNNYIEQIVNKKIPLKIDRFNEVLTGVLMTNRRNQKNALEKLIYSFIAKEESIGNANNRSKLISDYMSSIVHSKDSSLRAQSDNISSERTKVPFYNWLEE
ncbi:hypothetical protein [Viridibacillus arvi]|uniref:hypothetical protein n=1 Tax=Viridibacillus arvi TaxID=263475 RepID=UPI003D2753A8